MNIKITEVTEYSPDLLKSVQSLVGQLDSNFQELREEDLKEIITNPSTHLYIVSSTDKKEIIGMTTLVVYRIPYKMKAQIEDVVIDTDSRGKGIGTMLLQHVIEQAKILGVKSLNLTSSPKRSGANLLYQHLGFEKRETNVYRMNI